MYYVIRTQYLENYGVFDEPAQPRWKAKGGDTYLLYQAVLEDPRRMINNFIAEECVKHSPGGCTYPIGTTVEIPSDSAYAHDWCADNINEPWFKFVKVTSVNTWEIESVEINPDLFYEVDESKSQRALSYKVHELTEKADG